MRTILVVDDEPSILLLFKALLEREGYHVLISSSARDALRINSTHQGPIDLLITDVVMPGMHGVALAERMRELRKGIPVLYISGYTEYVIQQITKAGTGLSFLPKPVTPEMLYAKVREALTSG